MKSYQHLGLLALALFVLTMVISSRTSHANEPSVESSGSSVTSEDMDRRADELVALLDSVVGPVLKAHRSGRSYEDELYRHLKEAAGMEARDVLNLELPDGTVVFAYNVPLTLSGSSRRLVMRAWVPRDPHGQIWMLAPMGDRNECVTSIESYPARELRYWEHASGEHLVVLAARGHGRGKEALSVWSLPSGPCIWRREFEYGDRNEIVLERNALVLRIKHEEISLEERVARVSLAEERYGWKDDLLVLLDRRTVAEDQHAMQEIP